MHPSFDIGFTTLPAYFTLLMVGFTLAILLAHREGVRQGFDGNTVLDVGLLMLACGLIGARALHIVADGQFWDYVHLCTDPSQVPGLSLGKGVKCASDAQCYAAGLGDVCEQATGLCRQSQDCLRVFKIWYGGYAYYGGFLLAVPVGLWFLRRRRQSLWHMADLAGFAIPLGLVLGRLGCFLAGCCFGEPTQGPLGVTFPRGSPAWDKHLDAHLLADHAHAALPVHATQLYEAIGAFALFAFCLWWYRRGPRFRGENFFLFMMGYAVLRFIIEVWRADDRGAALGLSTSQLISLPLFAWSAWVLWRRAPWPPEPARSAAAAATRKPA